MRFLDVVLSPFWWAASKFSAAATPAPKRAPLPALSGGSGPSRDEAIEPAYRVQIDWDPAMLKSALRSADGGLLRTAADLCDAILGDDRAPAVLATRCAALLGSPLTFEPGAGRRKKRALKAAEAEEDWWTCFPEDELSQLITWGVLLGVGLGELVWVDDPETGRILPHLKVWHPRNLRWDHTARSWFVRVDGGGEIPIQPGDGKWILYCPYGPRRPWAYGIWRGMGTLWLLKDFAKRDFGLVQEMHGQPTLVGVAPTPKQRQELAAMLRDLGRNSVLALDKDHSFDIVESQARNWEMFTSQIEIADRGFSILAIGTNLPTEVTAGVGTGATAQNLVRLDYKKSDAEKVATTLRAQALTWWAEFNFGNSRLAPWPVWEVEPPADLQAAAQRWLTAAQALRVLNPEGRWDVDLKDVEEELGLKLVVGEPPPPPPPNPFGGGFGSKPDDASKEEGGDESDEDEGGSADEPVDPDDAPEDDDA